MPIISIAVIVLGVFSLLGLPVYLANSSLELQRLCQTLAPPSPFNSWYSAMVCGSSVRHEPYYGQVVATGLIHLMVVSGSHLIFLETLLSRILRANAHHRQTVSLWVGGTLFAYVLFSGWQGPALRSWLYLSFKTISYRLKLNWTPLWIILFSIPLTYLCLDSRRASLSVCLSWCSALALHTPLKNDSGLRRAVVIYIFTLPLLAIISPPAPTSILFNCILGPVLGSALFPVSIAAFFLPVLTHWVDYLWSGFFWLTELAPRPAPQHLLMQSTASGYANLYAAALQLTCLWIHRRTLKS